MGGRSGIMVLALVLSAGVLSEPPQARAQTRGPDGVLVPQSLSQQASAGTWRWTNNCNYVVQVALAQPRTGGPGGLKLHNGSITFQLLPAESARQGYSGAPYRVWVCANSNGPMDSVLRQSPSYDSNSVICPTGGTAGAGY
jgi:hypothetical protein